MNRLPQRLTGPLLALAALLLIPSLGWTADIVGDAGFRLSATKDLKPDLDFVAETIVQEEKAPVAFLPFLATAVVFGIITLLTPCVFPMIPITVSFFLKQGEKKNANPLGLALVYALTIVLVLGVAAVELLTVFKDYAVNPWVNTALGLLFIFFTLSLFGMYDIVLPNFLVQASSSQEGRGGYLGTIFMALSFTIVSFTCVAPFMGGFAGLTKTEMPKWQIYAGGLTFAATFAAPFFLLALFPALLKKLPKSGSWMNTVKVFMGFLELAAALKFFRTAELRFVDAPTYFTYDFVLASWVALLIAAGLYLLGMYRLPHDYAQENIGVVRLCFALGAFAVGVYLFPALFPNGKEMHRPKGIVFAWVDSFLLPDAQESSLPVSGDLRRTLDEARKTRKLVFVDFTGVTCTNCKLNERNVFPKPEVAKLMNQYLIVQMYTDTVPANLYAGSTTEEKRDKDAELMGEFQKAVFGDVQLPLYAILEPQPNGKTRLVEKYTEGKINDVVGFVKFLAKPLEK